MFKKHLGKQAQKLLIYKMTKIILICLFSLVLIFTSFNLAYSGKIYPGISVAGLQVSGMSPQQTASFLSGRINPPPEIVLTSQNQNFTIPLSKINFSYDYAKTASAAYNIDRTGNVFADFYQRLVSPFRKIDLGLRINIDEEKLNENVGVISSQVSISPVAPSLKIKGSEVVVDKGKTGTDVDDIALRIKIGQNLSFAKNDPILIPLVTVDNTLNDQQILQAKARAEKLIGKSLSLKFEYQTYLFKTAELIDFLDLKDEYNKDEIERSVKNISSEINRNPQDPIFNFLPAQAGEGGKVKEFAPSRDGAKVKEDLLLEMISGNLRTLETTDEKALTFDIPTDKTPPKIKTADVNNLGIKELLGRGSSRFVGSIASRIHNISFASSKFKGVLVSPGETFSFNDVLGDVSKYTGYQQAFVIKEGRTVLGDGGGVCQVSSTLFRAALAAGLPIVERKAHSYRVGYYEQDSPPGFDATVYAPTSDLKFKNDTPNYLLIQSYVDPKKYSLVFEIYGTNDGRVATTTKPTISDQTSPPPDLYQDDPTLPAGKIKQVDYKAWGAKVTFNYVVKRMGEVIYQKTFVSNYRPWQAVYLRGTGLPQ